MRLWPCFKWIRFVTHVVPATRPVGLQPSLGLQLAPLFLVAVAYHWRQHFQMLVSVWREGTWYDTDDAMRMVGVRAFLEGQGWFDLVAHRMGGDTPVVMHWSRVVDVPLALIIRFFSMFVSQPMAETLTRLAFPTLLLMLLLIALMRVAELIGGPAARWPALVLGAMGGPTAEQFVPGRIDHHAPQIVLLAFMTLALLKSLQSTGTRQAVIAGALAALSLAISIENVPFFLAAIACLGIRWICRGPSARDSLGGFAAGLGTTAAILFGLTVPPGLWSAPVCDAFGAPYAVGVLAGCACLAAMARWTPAGIPGRLVAAGTGAAVLLAIMQFAYPGCLGSPFGNLPPLLKELWLDHVGEARPLASVIGQDPLLALPYLGPPLVALVAAPWLAWKTQGARRDGFLLLAGLTAAGLLAAAWMVRAESSLGVPVMITCAVIAGATAARLKPEQGQLMPVLLPLTVSMLLSSAVLGALVPDKPAPTRTGADGAPIASCTATQSLAELGRLPTLRLLTLMDAGPMILAQTAHSVFAAPYHRNIVGNLAALQTFRARPDQAREIAQKAGATHLAFCAGLTEVDVLQDGAPDGLAAKLARHEVPDWLTPISTPGVWQVFRVD